MATIPLPPDFSAFLKLLNAHEVRYLIVGGYAVGYHGYVRPTGDMDVWIEATTKNARRLVSVLNAFGFGTDTLSEALFLKPSNIVRMGYPPHRIEIMPSISGVTFSTCFEQRVEATWEGVPVAFIGLACLRQNKRASGRLKDLSDLEYLPDAD